MSDSSWTASYDDEQRLTSWDVSVGDDESWNLSPVGNWDSYTSGSQTETRTHGDAHELTGISGGNNAGSITYDSRGNMTSDTNGMSFSWDHDGMLESVTVPNTSPVGIEGTHTYEYDVYGRRLKKHSIDSLGGHLSSVIYVNLLEETGPPLPRAGRVIVEQSSSMNGSSTTVNRKVYAGHVDDLVATENEASGLTLFAHLDARLSLSAETQSNSASLQSLYSYTPHGKTSTTSSSTNSSTSFTGRDHDEEIRTNDFRLRKYVSTLGRFTSRDPWRYIDGPNLYRDYFSPKFTDPFGLQGTPPLGGIPPDATPLPNLPNCYQIRLDDFVKDLVKRQGRTITKEAIRNMKRGCIGMVSTAQACGGASGTGPFSNLPEDEPDTTCFLTENSAMGHNCGDGKRPYVFAKQGVWRNGQKPDAIGPNGQVPNNSVKGKTRGVFNYMGKTSNGRYYWANHLDGLEGKPMVITFCDTPIPVGPKYPNEIWCATCRKCGN